MEREGPRDVMGWDWKGIMLPSHCIMLSIIPSMHFFNPSWVLLLIICGFCTVLVVVAVVECRL